MRWAYCFGLAAVLAIACSDDDATTGGVGGNTSSAGGSTSASGGTASGGGGALPSSVTVTLVPGDGVSGMQRVNFALPLEAGQLSDESLVKVLADGTELSAARRGLAARSDGSLRSVQLQVDVDIDAVSELVVEIGAAGAADLELVPVEDTLVDPSGESGPRVWVLVPAQWLSGSQVTGPMLPDATPWTTLCDCAAWDDSAFFAEDWENDAGVWLYDRGTTMYRGYARGGDLVPLSAAYVETSLYRNRITGTGSASRNGVPGAADDVKYTYAQNLAIHYLLTGDDRFRESAEDMALAMSELWPNPGYAGGADFWTERHAGFSLLAYVWAAMVSDDRAAAMWSLADAAVLAYVDVQETYPAGYDDPDARCFAHHADAHGEAYGYFGCSPWMSAILADGLDAYATEGGANANEARMALVKLGRILAREGRDATGLPYYWMGVGTDLDEPDDYQEHIGESAYVIAIAWHHDGKADAELRAAADELVDKLASDGVVGQIRSFNWQCRSAVAAPWFLQP